MPELVGRAVRQLWTAAWKEAQDDIKAEREGLDAARREMERERRDMANEIARLEAENSTQAEEITRLSDLLAEQTTAKDEAEKANNALRIDNARLDERAKAAEGRAGELRDELEKLHGRLQELAAARPKAEPVPRGGTKREPKPE